MYANTYVNRYINIYIYIHIYIYIICIYIHIYINICIDVFVHVYCEVDLNPWTFICVGLCECERPRRRSRRVTLWHRVFFGVCNRKKVSVGWERKWKILPSIKNIKSQRIITLRFLLLKYNMGCESVPTRMGITPKEAVPTVPGALLLLQVLLRLSLLQVLPFHDLACR